MQADAMIPPEDGQIFISKYGCVTMSFTTARQLIEGENRENAREAFMSALNKMFGEKEEK